MSSEHISFSKYYSIQVSPQQGIAVRQLIRFLMKLNLNRRGKTISGMAMHKTTSCEPGKYRILFRVEL